jgi:anti-anti-sigma factor
MVDPFFEVVPAEGGKQTLRLVGELDLQTVPTFEKAIAELPTTGGITLDLSELSFIDSTGLHALLRFAESFDGGGPLVLANPTQHVVKVLEILGLDRQSAIRISS